MYLEPLAAVLLLAAGRQAVASAPAAAATAPAAYGLALEGEEAEAFLRSAKVVSRGPIGTGVTQSERLLR